MDRGGKGDWHEMGNCAALCGSRQPRVGKLRHIAVGRAHKYEAVRLFIADDHVRLVSEDGALIGELRIDPARDYQSLELSAMS